MSPAPFFCLSASLSSHCLPLVLFPEPSVVCSLIMYILFPEILGQEGSYPFNILEGFVSQEKDTCPGMVHGLGIVFLVSSPVRWVLHISVSIYGFWEEHHIQTFFLPPGQAYCLHPRLCRTSPVLPLGKNRAANPDLLLRVLENLFFRVLRPEFMFALAGFQHCSFSLLRKRFCCSGRTTFADAGLGSGNHLKVFRFLLGVNKPTLGQRRNSKGQRRIDQINFSLLSHTYSLY